MYGNAFSIYNTFLRQQAKCDDEGVDFDGDFSVDSNLLPIDVIAHFISASGIADAVAMDLSGSRFQGELVEVAEVFGLYGVFYIGWFGYARERQKSVCCGNDVIADEEVECKAGGTGEHVDGDEPMLQLMLACG